MCQKKGLWKHFPGRKTEAERFPKLSAQINSLFTTSCGKRLPGRPRALPRASGQVLPFSGTTISPVWEVQEKGLSYVWIRMMVRLWKLPQQKEQYLHSSEAERRR